MRRSYVLWQEHVAPLIVLEFVSGNGSEERDQGVELGIWQGQYKNVELPWMRWWDNEGNLLLTGEERAEQLAAKLRELGIDPDEL